MKWAKNKRITENIAVIRRARSSVYIRQKEKRQREEQESPTEDQRLVLRDPSSRIKETCLWLGNVRSTQPAQQPVGGLYTRSHQPTQPQGHKTTHVYEGHNTSSERKRIGSGSLAGRLIKVHRPGQIRKMCVQINLLFSCGHRSFDRLDNCRNLGVTCFGPSSKHRDTNVEEECDECTKKHSDTTSGVRKEDPWGRDSPWYGKQNGQHLSK